jgi:hypothetical protein
MKNRFDNSKFKLTFRRPVFLNTAQKDAYNDTTTFDFPYTLIRDNCSLLKFIIEWCTINEDFNFVVDLHFNNAPYAKIYFQHIDADDGDYYKFNVIYNYKLSSVFVVECL